MKRHPDSNATKHSMTALQRQYLDSKVKELLEDAITPLRDEVSDLVAENLELRSTISVLAARLRKAEDRFASDDKTVLTKSKIVHLMKTLGIYNEE